MSVGKPDSKGNDEAELPEFYQIPLPGRIGAVPDDLSEAMGRLRSIDESPKRL